MLTIISQIMKLQILVCLLGLFIISHTASAAIVIDVVSKGNTGRVMSDGHRARLDLPGEDGYMLMDYQSGRMLMVSPSVQQVIDLGNAGSREPVDANAAGIELRPLGHGPKIAGFTTVQFSLVASGQNCGVVFGSDEAMHLRGINQLFDALQSMLESQRNALGSFAAFIDSCTLASMNMAAHAGFTGMPMRMLDVNGKLLSEVRQINTGAEIPLSAFAVPPGYERVSLNKEALQPAQNVSSASGTGAVQPQNAMETGENYRGYPPAIYRMPREYR